MYPDPDSSSQKMYDRALASLPGGNTRTTVFMKPYPIYAARGEGCRVWDLDGNVYIDCINNFTSQIHGHAHPALIKAATAQLALGSAFGLPTESEVDLAELLAARLPSVDQLRFANSGTEAVMMALKAARAHTGRTVFAQRDRRDLAAFGVLPTNAARCSPVSVDLAATRSAGVPSNTIRPPSWPAPGPRSMIQSACAITD